jgi:WD40 repeat protein
MNRINLHHGEVSSVMISPDGKYLISAGADGTIFVMTMTDQASEPMPGAPTPEKVLQPSSTSTVSSPSKSDNIVEANLLTAE